MRAPPLAELYDLLRAEGFAIGVDDHVRIGRLLACEAAWTVARLHTAIAALVATDAGQQRMFDACWARWLGGGGRERPPGLAIGAADAQPPAGEIGQVPRPGEGEAAPQLPPVIARRRRARVASAVITVVTVIGAGLWVRGTGSVSPRGGGSGSTATHLGSAVGSGSSTGLSRGSTTEPGTGQRVVLQAGSGAGSGSAGKAGSGSAGKAATALGAADQCDGASPGFARPQLTAAQQAARSGSGAPPRAGAGEAAGSTGSAAAPGGGSASVSAAGSGVAQPVAPVAVDLAAAAIAVGAMLLVAVAIAAVRGARGRRRFVPGPWHHEFPVPPAVAPLLPDRAIEDAAADLTWRAVGAGHELDVGRSLAATVDHGGLPTPVFRSRAAAPRYVVLEDTAGGARGWQAIYDELLAGLAREGVVIERYRFTASPAQCFRADRGGRTVPLGELVDHADALIVIGDGDAGLDPGAGSGTGRHATRRAAWLDVLRHVPRRLWINPVPPARWGAGARAIAEEVPMAHGAARAVAALHAGAAGSAREPRPYAAVIDRAPGTASAVAALRAALGEPALHLVSAVAVAAPPTLAAARWLSAELALALDEQDWLAIATLPWFRVEAWPDGLRDRLGEALDAEAPDLARRARTSAAARLAASEPPRGSGAHLAWQLEVAAGAARGGDLDGARRALGQLAATPLAAPARRLGVSLGLPDGARRRRRWAAAVGAALVIGPAAYVAVASSSHPPVVPAPLAATSGSAGSAAPPVVEVAVPARCPADMVPVAAGTFRMGSPDGVGGKDEHPAHSVTLSAYCIDRTEVTVKAYTACVKAGACTAADEPEKAGPKAGYAQFCNGTGADRQDHPINCVDWAQARAYCGWNGRRLPSEAEWEYAARGSDGRTYPWGELPPTASRLNACGTECVAMIKRTLKQDWTAMYDASDGWETTAPVGSFPAGASAFCALDMAGNVWEWTADWYADTYQPAAVTNPTGPDQGTSRVVRGGSWYFAVAAFVRAASRSGVEPSDRDNLVGFRCARGDE